MDASKRRRGPASVLAQVDYGFAELAPDTDRPEAWTLVLDGYPQSYVDVGDPTHLEFEYMRRFAAVVDSAAPLGDPLSVLHLGGGALTMARYVAVTRPRSSQRVVERDAALTELVRRVLPLPRGADIRVRAEDARAAVESMGDARFDVLLSDVYGGARVPGRVGTVEFAAEAGRVLRPDGVFAANVADSGALAYTRAQVATLRTVFPHFCILAEPGVLRGRRFDNLVLVGSRRPLPIPDLVRAGARDPFPARVVHGEDLDRLVAGARPMTDATAMQSPLPPETIFG